MSKKVAQGLIDELQQLAVFSRCSTKELEALTRIGTVIRVDPGYTFMRQGRRGWEFFIVMDGTARCLVNDHLVARYESGEFFGEMAIIDNAPRSATVEAETSMTVLVVDSREFTTMLERAPSSVKPVMSAMAQRLRTAQSVS
jgi:CRP/FNR family transcriptional regulator, cyclic AMP receptor protein